MRAHCIAVGLVWLALFGAAGRLGAQDGSVRWKPQAGQFVFSSPAVTADGNTIYIGAWFDTQPNRGVLRAINRDGSQKWQFPKTTDSLQIDRVESSPAIGPDGTVYFGCGDGKIYGLDKDTGAKKFEFDSLAPEINNSPTIDAEGNVYIISSDSVLHALTRDLIPRWTHVAGYSFSIDTSVAIGSDGTLYVGAFDNNIYALNPTNGKDKWLASAGAAILTSPVIGPDGTIYVGLSDNNLAAVTRDGVKWKFPAGDQILAAPSLAADGTIYFGANDNKFYALKSDGSLKWPPIDLHVGIVSTPAVRGDGTIIFGANDNLVHALNPDGSQKWTVKTDDWIQSSPVIASDGSIYVGSFDGRIYAINGTASPASPLSSFSSWPMFNHDAAHSGRTSLATAGGFLVDLSTLAQAGNGANLIAGFVVQGSAPKRFLIRGVGPTLAHFGVGGPLADPGISLVSAGSEVGANDDWSSTDENFFSVLNATYNVTFQLDSGGKDAALVATLAPANYTAVVKSSDGGTGLALAEAYDLDVNSPTARLVNLSTRARAGSGANVLVAGLVIGPNGGPGTLRVLLRAIGPGLLQFPGISGVLARPTMNVYDSGGRVIETNTGWTSRGLTEDLAAAARLTGAFALSAAGAGSADCAAVVTLTPGNYTIQVTSADGTSGEALVEVYVVP